MPRDAEGTDSGLFFFFFSPCGGREADGLVAGPGGQGSDGEGLARGPLDKPRVGTGTAIPRRGRGRTCRGRGISVRGKADGRHKEPGRRSSRDSARYRQLIRQRAMRVPEADDGRGRAPVILLPARGRRCSAGLLGRSRTRGGAVGDLRRAEEFSRPSHASRGTGRVTHPPSSSSEARTAGQRGTPRERAQMDNRGSPRCLQFCAAPRQRGPSRASQEARGSQVSADVQISAPRPGASERPAVFCDGLRAPARTRFAEIRQVDRSRAAKYLVFSTDR